MYLLKEKTWTSHILEDGVIKCLNFFFFLYIKRPEFLFIIQTVTMFLLIEF